VLPGIVTAPVVPKVIRKGLFSTGFWVQVLLEKYLFQRPLYRIGQRLSLEGLSVSSGTLTGGLQRLGVLIQPLYGRILEHSRSASHWQMDETRWMVFAEVEGKQGHQWWLWVVLTGDTCAYLLDASRSSQIPQQHLGKSEGILNADRYSAYKALGEQIRIAFCWSHIRRDFVRIRDGYETLRAWADGWIERINELFGRNRKRLALRDDPQAFAQEDQALRAEVASLARQRDEELADPNLPTASHKALESLRTHWQGATLFVEHPDIPMDNNAAERALRTPVVGRKNYYGSGAVWSGTLSAMLFTLFQTCLRNQIDPQQFLLAFFEACAHHQGRPLPDEALDEWLPWRLSDEQQRAWAYPKHPP
jgi:transposase